MFILQQLCYIARLLIASFCGVMIGIERKNRSKEAGIRTHCVVACASALMMIISKYGFSDMAIGAEGFRGADGARIAAQVVSGIGFLGAGMIFVHKNTITGLTTAAGIWATSGVGLAIGAGMYVIGISASIIIILAQIILHRNFKWLKTPKSKRLYIKNVQTPDFQEHINNLLKERGVSVFDVHIEKTDEGKNYTFIIELPPEVSEEDIISGIEYSCKITSNK